MGIQSHGLSYGRSALCAVTFAHRAVSFAYSAAPVALPRPDEDWELRHGGIYYTEAGNKRGPALYQVCAAYVLQWRSIPQVTLMSCFVQLDYLSKAQAAELPDLHEDAIDASCQDLLHRQALAEKRGAWIHADQDWSGLRKKVGQADKTATAMQALEENVKECERISSVCAFSQHLHHPPCTGQGL